MFKKNGFTLVELLIAIAIIAVLAALIVAYFVNQIHKANDAKRLADITRIQQALEEYEKDHNCYPPADALKCNPGTGLQPYLDKIPCDPETHNSYIYEVPGNVCNNWYMLVTDIGGSPYTKASDNAPSVLPPTPGASGSGGSPAMGFYGCTNGICVPVQWDTSRPGPACDPNYQSSNCYGQCGTPAAPKYQCLPWR